MWYGLHARTLREGGFVSSIGTHGAAVMLKEVWFQEVMHRL